MCPCNVGNALYDTGPSLIRTGSDCTNSFKKEDTNVTPLEKKILLHHTATCEHGDISTRSRASATTRTLGRAVLAIRNSLPKRSAASRGDWSFTLGGQYPGAAYRALQSGGSRGRESPGVAGTDLPFTLSRQCTRRAAHGPGLRSAPRPPGPVPKAPGPASGVSAGAQAAGARAMQRSAGATSLIPSPPTSARRSSSGGEAAEGGKLPDDRHLHRGVARPQTLSLPPHCTPFSSAPSLLSGPQPRSARLPRRPGRCDVTMSRPLDINNGVSGAAFSHSLALRSVAVFRSFAFSASSHPFSLSALRCDEAESSPHPALAFLLLPALFYFSPSAAAATAAQLVSVPRFSPHVVPAAYGPGRLGYFCSR